MSGAFGVSRPGGVRTTLHGHLRWAGQGGRAASRVQASAGARSPRASGGGVPRGCRPRPGWCSGRTASPRSPSPAFVSHSSPVVRVSPTHQLMRPRGPEGFSPVSSCRTAVPRSAAGAVRSSRPEPPRAHVRATSTSYPEPPHTHVRTMSPSCPGPFRRRLPAPVVAQRLVVVGRRPTPYQPSLPPACERAPLEAVMRAPPREARSAHHAVRGGGRPAASLHGPAPELTAARPASRPSVPCDDGGDWPWPAVPAA